MKTTTIGHKVQYIQTDSKSERDKGTRFEYLVIETLKSFAEYEIDKIYSYAEWPERQKYMGLDATDIGIDLIAYHNDGHIIAIQCKCFSESNKVDKRDIDSFLAVSQRDFFRQRWIVTTSDWTNHAYNQIKSMKPAVKRIDFLKHSSEVLPQASDPVADRTLRPRQQEALENVVEGFKNHNRGRLIMACGTGKTFTSLRIAEQVVLGGKMGGVNPICRPEYCFSISI